MAVNSNAPITFATTGLPGGSAYCYTNPQQFLLDMVASLYGYLPGNYSTIIVSESEPAVSDRNKMWFKLETGGAPTGLGFIYFGGAWVTPNREAAGSQVRRIFRGTPADVWAYDGGDGTDPATNPPTSASGAMWEVDSDFAGRFPLGVGTLQPSGTVVALGDTGGADQTTQTIATMATHNHTPPAPSNVFFTQRPSGNTVGLGGTAFAYPESVTGDTGDGDPMTTVSPYLSVYFIKRTARTMYKA